MNSILRSGELPGILKDCSVEQLEELCGEIRKVLIETVSQTGGHLASNLGVVELTVALHTVFESPVDQFIFDVGHQCYTHKILTGRLDQFMSLRQQGGISGFPKPKESEHDIFITGHSSTSISAACGFAAAKKIKGEPGKAIAIIGDGAFTGGMVYEGLNNAGYPDAYKNLIVVLNDNEMSISKNVGGIARYLASTRTKKSYLKIKRATKWLLNHIPFIGPKISQSISNSKSVLKEALYHSTLFEDLGFEYLGPVDGHNIKKLIEVFRVAKANNEKPVFIHVNTIKGKGFTSAEENPGAYHGISTIDIDDPNPPQLSEDSYSSVFGRALVRFGRNDERVCAVTAAMKYATGLHYFRKEFPDRFFDVGIAEAHAVTFSAALAQSGMLPVFAVYSTFLQRAYDQVLHDAAIGEIHLVLAVDRAGIVGDDGETHQGMFDPSFLSAIPNVTVYSPYTYDELEQTLKKAIFDLPGVVAVRYPRGSQINIANDAFTGKFQTQSICSYELFSSDQAVLVCSYGREFVQCANAYKGDFDLLRLNQIAPLPGGALDAAFGYSKIIFVEEGMKQGGIGEHFIAALKEMDYTGEFRHIGVDAQFLPQSTYEFALWENGLDAEGIRKILHGGVV